VELDHHGRRAPDAADLPGTWPAILVVDDHVAVAQVVVSALRADGYERVDHVGPEDLDLEGIIAAAEELDPDVALVDLFLGGLALSGLSAISVLADRGVTVLAFTASDDPHDTARCLEAGAAAVLHKSEPFETVLQYVEKVAAGPPPRDPRRRGDAAQFTLEAHRRVCKERLEAFESLTATEAAVLRRLIDGETPQQIALARSVSIRTVRSHIESIHRKLDVRSQLAAVALAREAGWPRS